MTIQNHLRSEWRVTAHLDSQVAPLLVPDMKGVVIDIRPRMLQHELTELAGARHLHLPNRSRSFGDENHENSRAGFMSCQMLLGHFVLVFAGQTIDDRNAVSLCPGMQTTAEASGHAHQVIVIEILVRTVKGTPPHPKSPARLAHAEASIQHHTVHAVVTACQEITVQNTQLVGHLCSSSYCASAYMLAS